jgi:hypothetical protein
MSGRETDSLKYQKKKANHRLAGNPAMAAVPLAPAAIFSARFSCILNF